jgi:hypothetical protein
VGKGTAGEEVNHLLRLSQRVLTFLRFPYAIYWAIDTCFRLKRKMISSWAVDPSIQDRWAYFTAWKDYGPFVKTLGEQKEVQPRI